MARHEAFGHKLPLSAEQYEAMTAMLAQDTSKHALRNAALLAVWYDSLMRIEDVCGLSVGTVAGKDTFTVAQGKVSIASARTGKRRKRSVTCYLKPTTVSLVARYIASTGKTASDPLFTGQGRNAWLVYTRKTTKGAEYTTRVGIACEQVRQMFKRWCADLGLDPALYSTHSIRRTRITAMWRDGVRPKSVMLLAGHADARSTIAYDTPTQDELRSASLGV
jgi:integrase